MYRYCIFIYICILYRLNILIPVVVLKEFKELHIYQITPEDNW